MSTNNHPPVDAFAIAAPGLAPLLADELRALGIAPSEVSDAGVAWSGSLDSVLQVNLWSRLASRVLVRLGTFVARDFATLEKQGARIPWATVVAPGSTVRFRVTCRKSRLYHSDAVAERLARAVLKAVPSAVIQQGAKGVGEGDDDEGGDEAVQLIVVRFEHDQCTISADSSGALLHRRGWRQAVAKAPLRETLAAALLVASGWTPEQALVDPFCGSGTIGIEAALRARGIAPGLDRPFAMERWARVPSPMVRAQRDAARAAIRREPLFAPIVLSDRDAGACEAARANAERAGVLADVTILQQSLSDVDLAAIAPRGMVLCNPPYGLRVSDGADLRSLFSRLGEVVRAGGGWSLGALVPELRMLAPARMTAERVLATSNGGIRVGLFVARPRRSPGTGSQRGDATTR